MKEVNYDLIHYLIDFLYPFIFVFGFYVILYGDISPGGGFQGGAILASVFILQYLSRPINEVDMETIQITEKILFSLIIIIPFISLLTRYILFTNFASIESGYQRLYLLMMNMLLGMKVCLGLTVIFYEFVLHERRWSK
jgi:multicomponent Na+:H+ antiporter subunit B